MRKSILLTTAVMFLAVPADARPNDDADLAAAAQSGTEIIVTGKVEGYRTEQTSSATKTKTLLRDVPQAVTVLTREQIDDQAIRSVADLVRYVPGVSAGQGEGNRDQITLRGNNTTADFFVDGLRDDVQYFRSFYNVDRVEVLKGPNAMIFGRGGGGGVVNRVTKSPIIGSNSATADVTGDTFGSWAVTGDLNVDLGNAAFRLNSFYEELDNHRDFFEGARYAVNPVIGTELAGGIKLQLGYEHVSDSRVTDRGVPSLAGRPLTGFRDTFFGVPGINRTPFEANVVHARAEAPLTDRLTVNAQLLYGDYNKSYANAFPATAVSVNPMTGARTLGVEAYNDLTQRENFIAQGNAEWRASTGGIDHVVLFGGEYTRQDSGNERRNGFFNPAAPLTAANRRATVALTDPFIIPPFAFIAGPTGNANRQTRSELSQGSVYLQDQISIGDHVDVIAGIRYDRLDLTVIDAIAARTFQRSDDLWSPRFGLVLKPVNNVSVYGSYSRSYLPQSGDQFLSLTASAAALVPERFDNYELGAKWDVTTALQATVAIYQLDRSNARATGPTPGTIVLTGEQRSKGVELGLTGNVTKRWQTSLGYAYTDAEITSTTESAPAGRRVGQVPRHQFSLWNRYQLLDRLGVGVGVYHQADQFATISNAVTLPAYTRLDLALFAKLTDRIDAQVNIENVTNTTYFPVAHNDVNISTGAPTSARFTLRARF
ncbi:TonB-dependent siderophore receptor [Sphingomonas sp. 28-62-11]|uniref:TonB-dependent receptor n=1 Tax=Sphingomonas sp. 28-62-11 TaxID=1970432 RepID=UPI000BD9FE90|nr:MAG: TonB-dependent siderophore receptor [Sphingomonas sp. 28-62-11]